MANAKGTIMIGLVQDIRAKPEKARALLPASLHHYFDTRIVQASWYPLEDYIALLRVGYKIADNPPRDPRDFYEQMGRASARSQMSGVYSRHRGSTGQKAAATLLGAQYDSGQMNMVERSSGHAVLEWVGFALPAREICGTFTGYQAERMTLSGLDEVRVRHTTCRAEGGKACRWELDWKSRRSE
jgi:hypothetical protein